jgi:hypothetical protein
METRHLRNELDTTRKRLNEAHQDSSLTAKSKNAITTLYPKYIQQIEQELRNRGENV